MISIKYPYGHCGMCNNPAAGKGFIPLPNGKPSLISVKVCEEDIKRVVEYQPFRRVIK